MAKTGLISQRKILNIHTTASISSNINDESAGIIDPCISLPIPNMST